jgi:flagellar biosynthesis protein FlhB
MAEQGDQNDSDRSLDPTQKRLDEALKRGDVVKSQEVSTWFVIAGATLVFAAFSSSMSGSLMTTMRGLIANAHQLPADGRGILSITGRLGGEVLAAIGAPLLLLALAALLGNMVQHQLVWSTEQLKPKLSKISPLAGLKRMFSMQALANFAKGVVKIVVLATVMIALLWPQRHRLDALVSTDILGTMALTKSLALQMLGIVVAILAIVAAADFLFQYRQWYERQKMSMRELKEEFKQSEGDPLIKGKIRQLRMARARKRMIAEVPKASVIITNPTHFAVALQYERGMNAPICVAKGVDATALKIREVAEQHSIPIVENPPLARALHATVEVDAEIPTEHYKAVAEVIGFVMKMRRGFSAGSR